MVEVFTAETQDLAIKATVVTTTGEGHSALTDFDHQAFRDAVQDGLRAVLIETQKLVDVKFHPEKI